MKAHYLKTISTLVLIVIFSQAALSTSDKCVNSFKPEFNTGKRVTNNIWSRENIIAALKDLKAAGFVLSSGSLKKLDTPEFRAIMNKHIGKETSGYAFFTAIYNHFGKNKDSINTAFKEADITATIQVRASSKITKDKTPEEDNEGLKSPEELSDFDDVLSFEEIGIIKDSEVSGLAASSKAYYRARVNNQTPTFTQIEYQTLFSIRDRLKSLQYEEKANLTSPEAELVDRLSAKKNDSPTPRISMRDFEDLFFRSNFGLAQSYAYKSFYRHKKMEIDDLIQAASIGLVKAIRNYDPSKGTLFSTLATFYIRRELNIEVINQSAFNIYSGNANKLMEHTRFISLYSQLSQLKQKFQRNSDIELQEIVDQFNDKYPTKNKMTLDRAKKILESQQAVDSLATLVSDKDHHPALVSLALPPEMVLQKKQSLELLHELFKAAKLTEKQIIIVCLRYDIPYSVELPNGRIINPQDIPDGGFSAAAIGQMVGVTAQAILAAEYKAVTALKKAIAEHSNFKQLDPDLAD